MKYGIACSLLGLTLSMTSVGEEIFQEDALKVEGRVAFTEGPAYHSTGNVFFSDIANNRIMRRDRTGAMHVYRHPSGRANGLWMEGDSLYACEGGGPEGNRRVTRTNPDGTITVMADRFEGNRFNSPNDLALDSQGRIYFTDPRYGDRSDVEQRDDEGHVVEGVYRIDSVGEVVRVITHEVDRPNGIYVSSDNKFLFVADNVNDGPGGGVGGNRKLWRFALRSDGHIVPGSRKLLFDWGTDRGPDGIAMDQEGRIYAAAGFNHPNLPAETVEKYRAGIYVIEPEGGLVDVLPVPADMITNCTFGDEDRQTLYITAGHKLWSIRVPIPGAR